MYAGSSEQLRAVRAVRRGIFSHGAVVGCNGCSMKIEENISRSLEVYGCFASFNFESLTTTNLYTQFHRVH